MGKDKFYSLIREDQPLSVKASSLTDLAGMCHSVGQCRVEVASNMQQDLLQRVRAAVKTGEARRGAVGTAEELESHKEAIRQAFLRSLGGLPQTQAPLNPRVVGIRETPAFTMEKIVFESRPQVYVTCNLYRPAKRQQTPGPAILMLEGHHTDGKAAAEYQNVAQILTHAGFTVMMMDPFGQGERFEHYEADVSYNPIPGASAEHNLMDSKLKCIGMSLARYFLHDGLRALEYLASRPDVDENRIAVTGNSGGGTQTYMLAMAAYDKIAAIAPCSYNTDMAGIVESGTDMDNEQWWTGILAAGLDYADMLSAFAPKPMILLCSRYDFFNPEGAERTLEKVRAFWAQVGADDLPQIAFSDTEHTYSPSLARAAGKFFAKQLGLEEPDYSGYVFYPGSARELACTASGIVALDYPDTRTIQMELEEEYRRIRAERAKRTAEEDRAEGIAWLKNTVLGDREALEPHTRVYDSGGVLNYIYHQLVWRAQKNYWGAGVLLRDARFGSGPLPLVIALWPEGMRAIRQHSAWIHRQCSQGREILIADLAASGALSVNSVAGRGIDTGWSTKYVFNGLLVCLGDSLAAMRCYQAMRIPAALQAVPRPQPTSISYYGEGEFARYAKIAALLGGFEVQTDGLYQTWGEIVTDKYADLTYYMDWFLPGAAAHADMDDIDRWLREDGLM